MLAGSLPGLAATPTVRRLICCRSWALLLDTFRVAPGGRQLDVGVDCLSSPRHVGDARASFVGARRAGTGQGGSK